MAALYKRYIPPKSATNPAFPTSGAPQKDVTSSPSVQDGEKKRKRDRPEDEVVERKAKKLKKKGIDPPVQREQHKSSAPKVLAVNDDVPQAEDKAVARVETDKPRSEFAHVKNLKKRHKLEKEARKARKENAKVATEDAADETLPAPDSTVVEAAQEEVPREVVEVAQPAALPPTERTDDSALSRPKKRRHKLESALQTSEDVVQGGLAEDEHLKKHSGVLDKYQKSAKRSQDVQPVQEADDVAEHPILHDLVPLPQPESAPSPEFRADYSALPQWLAKPTIVSSDQKATFSDMKLAEETVAQLSSLGFKEALPVQQALIPLLLPPGSPGSSFIPGTEAVLPDIAVSAATGSGKTLAYLLPIIQALKRTQGPGKLKALVVVPTQELVAQVATVAEQLVKDSGLHVGKATGTGKFKDEQERLVKQKAQYDPEAYSQLMLKARERDNPAVEDSEEHGDSAGAGEEKDAREDRKVQDAISGLLDNPPVYDSTVDILVCTPGRLLEHINSTLGFSLAHLQWLVLDEADKLLDQQYDGFLDILNGELSRERTVGEQDGRERLLRVKGLWKKKLERRVRKVILSATMTTDISKLTELRLQRPRLVVVRGGAPANEAVVGVQRSANGVREVGDDFELPPTLVEYCVPVGDGSDKPLQLIELLQSKILTVDSEMTKKTPEELSSIANGFDDDASSDSDVSDSSDLSTSSSEVSSSSEEDSEDSDPASEASSADAGSDAGESPAVANAMHPQRAALLAPKASRSLDTDTVPTVLIFTSSTESAQRLSHLLKNLKPTWAPWITTLAKTISQHNANRNADTSKPSITISTDRAARGLDHLGNRAITHVLQYDVPNSKTSYVHRVGRTARAGRSGEAWTLYTHAQARWFLYEITKPESVRRANAVEKVKLDVQDEGLRERYQETLASMREEVYGGAKGRDA